MSQQNAYPLEWPPGWPRAKNRSRARFSSWGRELSPWAATGRLESQLDMMRVRHFVLSTNLELRRDGTPRSGGRAPDDPGVALYFELYHEPYSLACDRWDRVADNIAAIAAHLNAMRGQERWGVGNTRQAFAGYKALPTPEKNKPWWEVLECPKASLPGAIEAHYRAKAKQLHPDMPGGSHAAMQELNAAFADASAT